MAADALYTSAIPAYQRDHITQFSSEEGWREEGWVGGSLWGLQVAEVSSHKVGWDSGAWGLAGNDRKQFLLWITSEKVRFLRNAASCSIGLLHPKATKNLLNCQGSNGERVRATPKKSAVQFSSMVQKKCSPHLEKPWVEVGSPPQ